MSKLIITGEKPLAGVIEISGAKNAAIKMIAASIIVPGVVTLENVPKISDVDKISEILIKMGANINRDEHRLVIDTTDLQNDPPDPELVKKIRASVVLIGPLLARFGKVSTPHPGGDKIGSRPIDRHIKAFQDLGVKVSQSSTEYIFENGQPHQEEITFEKISVTGTENVLLFAAGMGKKVTIHNVAIEPEIIDLISFLNKAGCQISVDGRTIRIEAVKPSKAVAHKVLPDRIETGTFAALAIAAKSEVKITHTDPKLLESFLDKLKEIGVQFEIGEDFIYIKKSEGLKAVDISTAEYPGLATDLGPPLGVLLTQCEGKSKITENIFENRLGYLKELQHMGANVAILDNRNAEITGPTKLVGAQIESLDIRSGATLLIAGAIAEGQTVINEAENIDRGYENIEERLRKIGVEILRSGE